MLWYHSYWIHANICYGTILIGYMLIYAMVPFLSTESLIDVNVQFYMLRTAMIVL